MATKKGANESEEMKEIKELLVNLSMNYKKDSEEIYKKISAIGMDVEKLLAQGESTSKRLQVAEFKVATNEKKIKFQDNKMNELEKKIIQLENQLCYSNLIIKRIPEQRDENLRDEMLTWLKRNCLLRAGKERTV